MPSTIEQVLQHLATVLQTVPGVAAVERDRESAIAREECADACIVLIEHDATDYAQLGSNQPGRAGRYDADTRLAVTVIARGGDRQARADAVVCDVHATLASDAGLLPLAASFGLTRRTSMGHNTDASVWTETLIYRMRQAVRQTDLTQLAS